MRGADQVAAPHPGPPLQSPISYELHLPPACCCLRVVAADKALSQHTLTANNMSKLESSFAGPAGAQVDEGAAETIGKRRSEWQPHQEMDSGVGQLRE